MRIDTIPEVPKWYWTEFVESAGIFHIGEVFDLRVDFVADYQKYVDSLLNYHLFYGINEGFRYGNSLYALERTFNDINKKFKDPSVLGNFISNHDNERFLYKFDFNNLYRFRNAITVGMLAGKKA